MTDPNRDGTPESGRPIWAPPMAPDGHPYAPPPVAPDSNPYAPPPMAQDSYPYAPPPMPLPAPRPVAERFGGPPAPTPTGWAPSSPPGYPPSSPPGYPPSSPPGYPPVGASPYVGPAVEVRGNKGLGVAMLVLGGALTGFFVLRALLAPAAVHRLDLYAARGIDTRRVVTPHDLVGLLGLVTIPLFIVGALWLHRAQSNARALAPHQVRRHQAWSWFGWVTPIASWFVPKQIVDDAWRVTAPPELGPGRRGRRRSTALWWGLWVGFGLVSGFGTHLSASWGTGRGSYPATQLGACGCLIYTGHRGISPGWEALAALLAVAAYAAFVPIALGLSDAQELLVTRLRGTGPLVYGPR